MMQGLRRSAAMVAVAGAAVLCAASLTGARMAAAGTHAAAGARAAASGGTWGTAVEVPGTAALNRGGVAGINSVSCASAGNCSAGGFYVDNSGNSQVFVVGETNGTWGIAKEVPGTAALNHKVAGLTSVSCGSAGNCSAGGSYRDATLDHDQAYVVSEKNGTWGTAKQVPSTAALNTGGFAEMPSVSCASAGNCSAGGDYFDRTGFGHAFVVSEKNGTWGTATKVPGTAALGKGTGITSLSCASAGNCSAGGFYNDSSGFLQAFVVGETNGTWGTALEVPGTAALNHENAEIPSVSCASAGNCSAGGFYTDSSGHRQAYVVSETNGTGGTTK